MLPLISPTGSKGFTLLELMVVVFVIGLLSGVVALSIPSGRSDSTAENSIQLQLWLRQLRERSIFSNQSTGLVIRGDELIPLSWQEQSWVRSEAPQAFTLPEQTAIAVSVEGTPVEPLDQDFQPSDEQPWRPQLVFFPDGQFTRFLIHLIHPTQGDWVFDDLYQPAHKE